MRTLLTFLLLAPTIVMGQFRASVNLGAGITSKPKGDIYKNTSNTEVSPTYYTSASLHYETHNWLIGVKVQSFKMSYKEPYGGVFIFSDQTESSKSNDFLKSISNETFGSFTGQIGKSLIAIGVDGGRVFKFNKFELPICLNASYLLPIGNYKIVNQGRTFESNGLAGGYSFGLSFSPTYYLTKNFGIQLQLMPSYFTVDKGSINGYIIPVSAGIAYTFK